MINCTQKLNKMSGDTSPLGIHVKNDIKELHDSWVKKLHIYSYQITVNSK
jgi:hypothetical protein